jgi:xylulokinase
MTAKRSVLMGIDVGSSDCKVLVVDGQGRVVAHSRQPYPTHVPCPGWAEQSPEDWYQATCRAVRTCLHLYTENNND